MHTELTLDVPDGSGWTSQVFSYNYDVSLLFRGPGCVLVTDSNWSGANSITSSSSIQDLILSRSSSSSSSSTSNPSGSGFRNGTRVCDSGFRGMSVLQEGCEGLAMCFGGLLLFFCALYALDCLGCFALRWLPPITRTSKRWRFAGFNRSNNNNNFAATTASNSQKKEKTGEEGEGESTSSLSEHQEEQHQQQQQQRPRRRRHGARHLAIIMDGNRRYGKKAEASSSSYSSSSCEAPRSSSASRASSQEINTFCESVLSWSPEGEREEEKRRASSSSSSSSSSWWLWESVDAQYQTFASLLRYSALDGHRLGGEKLNEVLLDCIDLGVEMVTVYAFSTENWNRPAHEVNVLMTLFYFFFERIRKTAAANGFFIRFISSEPDRLPTRVRDLMVAIENETRQHSPRRLVANVCVSYSGRTELVAACQRIVERRAQDNTNNNNNNERVNHQSVSEEELSHEMLRSLTQSQHESEDKDVLAANGGVDPQVMLRTSGEQRLSNFLLYECAYTELFFVDKTWPEVNREDVESAIQAYEKRDKRFGR